MKQELRLSPTILDRFYFTKEPFAIIDGILMTEGGLPVIDSNVVMYHCGKNYVFSSSDSISLFRDELFDDHRPEIESYMNWVIDFKLIRRLQNASNKASTKIDYYSRLKQKSLDKFISDVFDAYCHKRGQEVQKTHEIDTTLEEFPSFEDLKSLDSVIQTIIPEPGIVVFNGSCFSFANYDPDFKNPEMLKDTAFYLDGKKKGLIYMMELKTLAEEYEIQLRGEIEKFALGNGKKFQDQIMELTSQMQNYDFLLGKLKSRALPRQNSRIGYERLGQDNYVVYVKIEPFLIEKDGNYYVFNEDGKTGSKTVKVGSVIHIDSQNVSIAAPPIVLNMPYHHPFVFSDGEICYESDQRWNDLGINFLPHKYERDQPGLARKVASLLWESSNNITQGYIGSEVVPVNGLFRFKPVANSLENARTYARQNRIAENRIFNN